VVNPSGKRHRIVSKMAKKKSKLDKACGKHIANASYQEIGHCGNTSRPRISEAKI
jgi:hypothetical protein